MTVGERLREARERQKVSLHAIAEKTNISVRFLDAIEKNQFEKLPGGIFTRGFIRSYALQVGLDPDATVAQFLSDEPSARDETDDGPVRQGDGPGLGTVMVAGVVLIAVVLGLVYFFAPDWLGLRSAASPTPQEATAPADADPPSAAPGDVTATSAAAPAVAASDAPAPPVTSAPLVPAAAAPPTESPKAPLHLVIAPTGRCWVQVSADGQMRVAREVAAGERVSVDAAERLQIVVGDAGAFAYELNGRAGKPLGAAGRVARATIAPSTVAQFQAP